MIGWSRRKRYAIWTVIWAVMFMWVVYIPIQFIWLLPGTLGLIIFLALIKDAIDFWYISKGYDSLGHKWFEHTPLIVLIFLYSAYGFYATGDQGWAFLGLAAFADIIIDVYQDFKCCDIKVK